MVYASERDYSLHECIYMEVYTYLDYSAINCSVFITVPLLYATVLCVEVAMPEQAP